MGYSHRMLTETKMLVFGIFFIFCVFGQTFGQSFIDGQLLDGSFRGRRTQFGQRSQENSRRSSRIRSDSGMRSAVPFSQFDRESSFRRPQSQGRSRGSGNSLRDLSSRDSFMTSSRSQTAGTIRGNRNRDFRSRNTDQFSSFRAAAPTPPPFRGDNSILETRRDDPSPSFRGGNSMSSFRNRSPPRTRANDIVIEIGSSRGNSRTMSNEIAMNEFERKNRRFNDLQQSSDIGSLDRNFENNVDVNNGGNDMLGKTIDRFDNIGSSSQNNGAKSNDIMDLNNLASGNGMQSNTGTISLLEKLLKGLMKDKPASPQTTSHRAAPTSKPASSGTWVPIHTPPAGAPAVVQSVVPQASPGGSNVAMHSQPAPPQHQQAPSHTQHVSSMPSHNQPVSSHTQHISSHSHSVPSHGPPVQSRPSTSHMSGPAHNDHHHAGHRGSVGLNQLIAHEAVDMPELDEILARRLLADMRSPGIHF